MVITKSEPIEGLLSNITVYEYVNDSNNTITMRHIVAHEGYAIYDKIQETGLDEEGNEIPPTYHYMFYLATATPLSNYEAVLIKEGMEIVGDISNAKATNTEAKGIE